MKAFIFIALFAAGAVGAQQEMTRSAIAERVAKESDPKQAAAVETVLLGQWVALSKNAFEMALRNPDLSSPEIDVLREKEKELEKALLQTRLAIVEAARKLPAMQERQKEIDEAQARLKQLEKPIEAPKVK